MRLFLAAVKIASRSRCRIGVDKYFSSEASSIDGGATGIEAFSYYSKALQEPHPFSNNGDDSIRHNLNKAFALIALSREVFNKEISELLNDAYETSVNTGKLDQYGEAINYGFKKNIGASGGDNCLHYVDNNYKSKSFFAEVSEQNIIDADAEIPDISL